MNWQSCKSLKKKTKSYKERNEKKRTKFIKDIEKIQKEKVVYVNEPGMDTYLYREYGRAPRGQKVEGKISGKKYVRTSIVAGKCDKNIIAPLKYSGMMDSNLFKFWFKEMLLRKIPKGYTVVMDNCSVHRKPQPFKFAEKAEVNLIFLPPYSPDLNPIEKFWAWLKLKLRSLLTQFTNFTN